MCMCTLKNHVEKLCTLVSQNYVYFKIVYSVMAPPHDYFVLGILLHFHEIICGKNIFGNLKVSSFNFTRKLTTIVPLSLHSNLQSLLGITIKLWTPIRFFVDSSV